ncbi:MAG: UDP-N-acetylmuramoyl-L-alanine--D-glutamate ligase [Thermoanaerobaculales bacterium]|jgi:UDP-N-acetylmuramoylalanine--D-glutamate ligase|nr:UDP-N-acetylmuramoyl-L-alanine--D-glutamate ligase [Thermoanaerobaculales bacterium]
MVGLGFSRVLVVGLGRSGAAAARLAAADGAEVVVTDQRPPAELAAVVAALPSGAVAHLGGHPAECLEGVDLVVVSPGVPPTTELLATARRRGLELVTEVEFAWRHRPDAPLAAVTGSNGKSTVTTLVAEMLSAAGFAAVAGGNLGTAASDLLLQGDWDRWVLEISSFQAELLTAMAPDAAVFLNLSQDHLERHADLADYLAAKRRLFAFQSTGDTAVLNADDPASAATESAASRRFFSLEGPADGWLDGDRLVLDGAELIRVERVRLAGAHNLANLLAAALAALALGADRAAIATVAASFDGLAHRHRVVHEASGVRWIDDSKATNIGATLAALRGYPEGSLHLILGGQAKGQDFSVLVDEVRRAVARLYVIGVDGPPIADALAGSAPIESCDTLDEAVRRARARATAGQTVLLAPACASFDQFKGYDHRGDVFASLAREEVAACR